MFPEDGLAESPKEPKSGLGANVSGFASTGALKDAVGWAVLLGGAPKSDVVSAGLPNEKVAGAVEGVEVTSVLALGIGANAELDPPKSAAGGSELTPSLVTLFSFFPKLGNRLGVDFDSSGNFFTLLSQNGFSGSWTGWLKAGVAAEGGADGIALKENGATVGSAGTEAGIPKFIAGGGAGNFVSFKILEDAKKLGRPPLDGGGGTGVVEGTTAMAGTLSSGVGTRAGAEGVASAEENGLGVSASSLPAVAKVMVGGFGEAA